MKKIILRVSAILLTAYTAIFTFMVLRACIFEGIQYKMTWMGITLPPHYFGAILLFGFFPWCGSLLNKAFDTSIKKMTAKAEEGEAEAQFNLACAYDEGKGVLRSAEEAVKWWHKAAEQGHAIAQYNLGLAYEIGEGVTEDETEALKWYRMAAEQGNEEAKESIAAIEKIQENATNT